MKYFKKSDIVFPLLITLLEILLIFFYIRYTNYSYGYSNSEKLGIITFKKRTATRRSTNSLQWLPLQNSSPVYSRESIRTGSLSEAEIKFEDGVALDLLDRSLIKLRSKHEESLADILDGSVLIKSGNMNKSITVAGKLVKLQKDSKIIVTKTGDTDVDVEVTKGSIEIETEEDVFRVEQYQTVTLNENTNLVKQKTLDCIPILPEHNTKFISVDKEFSLNFSWLEPKGKKNNSDSQVQLSPTLLLATDKHCNNIVNKSTNFTNSDKEGFNVNTTSLKMTEGIYYWQIVYPTGEKSAIRRFVCSMLNETNPILPIDNEEFSYRIKPQDIQFSWNKDEEASSVLFELSNNSDFKTTIEKKKLYRNNFTVKGLAKGEYYWRVIPKYKQELIGYIPKEKIFSFRVVKKENLAKPTLNFPSPNYLVNIKSFNEIGINFSWNESAEAKDYELLLYAENSEKPVKIFHSQKNYLHVTKEQTDLLTNEGNYFFAVRYKDEEGYASPESEKRKFSCVKTDLIVKPLYPPNGYQVFSSLMMNQKFSWKTQDGITATFIMATDSNFTNIIEKRFVQSTSFVGMNLKAGEYYWKLRVYNTDNSILAETESRKILVVHELHPPDLITPKAGSSVPLLPEQWLDISWQNLPFVDYYSFTLQNKDGKRIIYEPYTKKTSIKIQMGNYPQGVYTINLQAFKLDSELSSRNIGLIGSYKFVNRRLSYIELISPKPKQKFNGLLAFNNGIDLHWKIDEQPDSESVIIKKDGKIINPKIQIDRHTKKAKILQPSSGSYEWTVKGFIGNFDISSKKAASFIVSPITPFPAPVFDTDKMVNSIGVDYLQKNRSIVCAWKEVQNANSYTVILENQETGKVVQRFTAVKTISIEFTNLNLLSEGAFLWRVQAEGHLTNSNITRTGKEAVYEFKINLPKLNTTSPIIEGEYYGY